MHRTYHWLALVAILGSALVGGIPVAAQSASTPEELCAAQNIAEPETREFEQAGDVLVEGTDYYAVLCTEAGPVVADLFEQQSPITVNSFVFLAEGGFFNNTTFHRVLPGFMAQGGDPTATGSGGPGYQFEDETANGLVFDRGGLLAMANGGPNTNGSQFFITYGSTPWLDGAHTVFGEIVQGIEAAELLRPRDPDQGPAFDGATLNTVLIVADPASLTVTRDGPPSIAHFQTMLAQIVAPQITEQFVIDPTVSHTYDLENEVERWRALGSSDTPADWLRGYLEEHDFVGTAAVSLPLDECPATASDLPIWLLGFEVSDFGPAGAAEVVVFDDARTETLEAAGVFETHSDPADVGGRVYSKAMPEAACGATGVLYRLELAYGRYLVAVNLLLDSSFISDTTDPSGAQYLGYVMQDLFLSSIGGTLERGSVAS